MFGMGGSEIAVIGIIALIVVGPQELPGLFRQVGKAVGKAKGMAREFSRAMDQAADQAGVNDINKTIRAASNPVKFGTDQVKSTLSPEREEVRQKMDEAMAKAARERHAREAEEAAKAEAAADEALIAEEAAPQKKEASND